MDKKPVDRWLGLCGVVLGIAMIWIPKTPLWLIGSLVLMFLLLLHPLWNFWWIEKKSWRQWIALLIMVFSLAAFGYCVWPVALKPIIAPNGVEIPDIVKFKEHARKTAITSLNQFALCNGPKVSKTFPGSFELSVGPSNDPYSASECKTKQLFRPNIYVSVKIVPELILTKSRGEYYRNAQTLELVVGDVYFLVDSSCQGYFIWEVEPLKQTGWRPLNVRAELGFNTLSVYQNGKDICVWVNDIYVDSFTKLKEPKRSPVCVKLKANAKTGGTIYFRDLEVWEDP
jgi:hypothetical protein